VIADLHRAVAATQNADKPLTRRSRGMRRGFYELRQSREGLHSVVGYRVAPDFVPHVVAGHDHVGYTTF